MNGLRTGLMLRMLTTVHPEQREMYRRFMEADDGDAVVPERLRSPLGSNATAEQWLSGCAPRPILHQHVTLGDTIEAAAQVVGVSRAALLSRARAPLLTIARALVTRYAIRTGIAPLAEVEQALGRRRSALYHAIARYEPASPEVFRQMLEQLKTATLEDVHQRAGPPDDPATVERLRSAGCAKSPLRSASRGRAVR
jgi:hypothetical protein